MVFGTQQHRLKCFFTFALLFATLVDCECKPARHQVVENLDPYVNVPFAWKQIYDSSRQELVIEVELKKGFHAYAPGEQIGRPVFVDIDNANGWHTTGEVTLPKGLKKSLGSLGESVVLEGQFQIQARVVGGKGPINGILHMQICTEQACDRPREHAFSVKTNQ